MYVHTATVSMVTSVFSIELRRCDGSRGRGRHGRVGDGVLYVLAFTSFLQEDSLLCYNLLTLLQSLEPSPTLQDTLVEG